jgi:hypothetical protein
VGNQITQPDFQIDIFVLPQLPNLGDLVEWAIQLPNVICHLKSPNCQNYPISVTRLNAQSNQPAQFPNLHLQIAKIINLVQWAMKLPNSISQLTPTNCFNYHIFATRLSGQSNHPTQFPN